MRIILWIISRRFPANSLTNPRIGVLGFADKNECQRFAPHIHFSENSSNTFDEMDIKLSS